MALKGLPLKLLQELKYQHGFPPRSRVTEIKNEMAARGLGRSSMLAHEVANAYLKVIETIVDEFAERALSKNGALGLGGQADIRAAVMAAHEELFDVAASLVGGEVGAGDYGRLAVT